MMGYFIKDGVDALKGKNKELAHTIFTELTKSDSDNPAVWMWLAVAAKTQQERTMGLHRAYELAPEHPKLQSLYKKYNEPYPPQKTAPSSISTQVVHNEEVDLTVQKGRSRVPHLLSILLIVLITSHSLILLMGQSSGYWQNYTLGASGILGMSQVLQMSPFLLIGITAVYAISVYGALRILPYTWGLVLWLILTLLHLDDSALWLKCTIHRIFPSSEIIQCANIESSYFVLMAIVFGLAIATSLRPIVANQQSVTSPHSTSIRPYLLGSAVWLFLLVSGVFYMATTVFPGWTFLGDIDSFEGRYDGRVATTSDGTTWIFGGIESNGEKINDFGFWQDNQWIWIDSEVMPAARSGHLFQYDPVRHIIVLSGGSGKNDETLRDTWEWDLATKTWQDKGTDMPSPRCCHLSYYDQQANKIITYGGNNTERVFFDDAWAWDGDIWTPWDMTGDPYLPYTSGYPFAYDAIHERGILLDRDYTLELKDNHWQKVETAQRPDIRSNSSFIYHPEYDLFILIGGIAPDTDELKNCTWVFKDNEWYRLEIPHYDGLKQWGHNIFYQDQQLIIVGGTPGTFELTGNMWELVLTQDIVDSLSLPDGMDQDIASVE